MLRSIRFLSYSILADLTSLSSKKMTRRSQDHVFTRAVGLRPNFPRGVPGNGIIWINITLNLLKLKRPLLAMTKRALPRSIGATKPARVLHPRLRATFHTFRAF